MLGVAGMNGRHFRGNRLMKQRIQVALRVMGLTRVVMILALVVLGLPSSAASFMFGHLVQIQQLAFHPDTLTVPGDAFAVLVVQNREEAPIIHEVFSKELFLSGTLIQVLGSGTVEFGGDKRVSRVLLDPDEEVVIWFYAVKGMTYTFQCNINGHAMLGTILAV
jgi:uncharacterized cupredoxin-like copper-binding protein